MKKRNAGDLGGPSISGISSVDKAQCFTGTTTDTTRCNTAPGMDYSGCNRTVCNWYAANAICKSIGWSLPTDNQLRSLGGTYYTVALNKQLQFCDSSSSSNASQCGYHPNNCNGSWCQPDYIWGSSRNDLEAYIGSTYSQGTRFMYYLSGNNPSLTKATNAYSVRCVKE